jgi:peptide/nickel transport system substrate-binding protein
MKDYRLGQYVNAERNPDYYEMGADNKPLPYLDGYQSVVFPDYTAEVAALRAGQIDTVRFSGLRKTEADVLRKTNPDLRYYTQERFSNSTLWFNLKKAPWNDVRVRKAAQLVLNREDLIASYQGAAAHAGFIPPAFKEYLWPEEKLVQKFKPDVEQAKKLMAEAGIPPGSINVTIVTGAPYAQGAEVAAEHLKQIGIASTIDVMGDSFTPILQKGNLKDLGWGNLGSVQFLTYWLSDIAKSTSNQNYVGFSDAKVDQLADAQARESSFDKRFALADQEQERLYELMPWVPTVSEQYHRFESCRLRNSPKISPNYNPRSVVFSWLDPTGC